MRLTLRYASTLLTFGKAFVLCRWLTVLALRRGDRQAFVFFSPLREYFVNLRQSLRPMPVVNGARVAERRPAGVYFSFSPRREYFVNLRQSLRPMPVG